MNVTGSQLDWLTFTSEMCLCLFPSNQVWFNLQYTCTLLHLDPSTVSTPWLLYCCCCCLLGPDQCVPGCVHKYLAVRTSLQLTLSQTDPSCDLWHKPACSEMRGIHRVYSSSLKLFHLFVLCIYIPDLRLFNKIFIIPHGVNVYIKVFLFSF